MVALGQPPNVTIHLYPSCNHAFARNSETHFNAEAAAKANAKTLEFLKQKLN